MRVLTNGFYFDLALIVLFAVIAIVSLWRRRYVDAATRKHLAEDSPPNTHEGDWDWPRRQEQNRLLRS